MALAAAISLANAQIHPHRVVFMLEHGCDAGHDWTVSTCHLDSEVVGNFQSSISNTSGW